MRIARVVKTHNLSLYVLPRPWKADRSYVWVWLQRDSFRKFEQNKVKIKQNFVEPGRKDQYHPCHPSLVSCPEQLNRWPCPLVHWSDWTNNQSLHKPTEWSHTLVTFGTFDQTDEETWPDQNRSTYLHTYISIREHSKGAIIRTCDIWDTDYNTDNREPGFMRIDICLLYFPIVFFSPNGEMLTLIKYQS